jgi:hypothetical protein
MQIYTFTSVSNNVYAHSKLIILELDSFELGMRNQFRRFKKKLLIYVFRMKRSFMYKQIQT